MGVVFSLILVVVAYYLANYASTFIWRRKAQTEWQLSCYRAAVVASGFCYFIGLASTHGYAALIIIPAIVISIIALGVTCLLDYLHYDPSDHASGDQPPGQRP